MDGRGKEVPKERKINGVMERKLENKKNKYTKINNTVIILIIKTRSALINSLKTLQIRREPRMQEPPNLSQKPGKLIV